MPIADNQDIPGFDDLFDSVQLVHDLTLGAQSDYDEVHVDGFCGHRDLIDVFREDQIIVKIDGTAPSLCPVDICFLNIRVYHVLIF
jgi:hypothetical protein